MTDYSTLKPTDRLPRREAAEYLGNTYNTLTVWASQKKGPSARGVSVAVPPGTDEVFARSDGPAALLKRAVEESSVAAMRSPVYTNEGGGAGNRTGFAVRSTHHGSLVLSVVQGGRPVHPVADDAPGHRRRGQGKP